MSAHSYDPYSGPDGGNPIHLHVDIDDTDNANDTYDELLERIEKDNALGEVNYYGVMNLSKDASDDEIRNTYRRLCVTFHPDKHLSPDDKEAAQRKFQVIQKAYDVLSDPAKRHIYDLYGAEGLQSTWEIGQRFSTPEEIREEFERQKRLRLQEEAENLVKSKGEISLMLDATSIFEPYGGHKREAHELLVFPELTQAFVKHSWETKLASQTNLTLEGTALANNGIGVGSAQATLQHVITPSLWAEGSVVVGRQPSSSFKLTKTFANDSFCTANAHIATTALPPTLAFVLGRRISQSTTMFLTFQTGQFRLGSWGASERLRQRSSCSVGIVRRFNDAQLNVDVQAGLSGSHISLAYAKILPKQIRLRGSLQLSNVGGVTASLSGEKKVSKHSRVGLGVTCGASSGVSFKLKYTRLGQKFIIPVLLSHQLSIEAVLWATVAPVVAAIAIDQFILAPRKKQLLAEKLDEIRKENAEILADRQKEALEATRLMKDLAQRKLEQEQARDGLIIVHALYGDLAAKESIDSGRGFSVQGIRSLFSKSSSVEFMSIPSRDDAHPPLDQDADRSPKPYCDVTIVLQSMVNNSQLHISGGHAKSSILGFYDPCLGTPKKLRVIYQFQGRLHQAEVDDFGAFAAPLRAHLVSENPV
ncbi:uncharacterized protein BJ171DRAFT_14942 [Polychytrium aggregatum]|uniref:uncharacterized protein n=1 Tax=Polychytrium aggregatum TaxID=110093 RepID=UPI0022FF27BC|nr:uncharacterized protein BJ171DRAFT_14942 [Polychytrium aggregatum]KAI9206573.1 hypothetical protein BJ171DRAFT_14942 [Polychytrium aggregatum]